MSSLYISPHTTRHLLEGCRSNHMSAQPRVVPSSRVCWWHAAGWDEARTVIVMCLSFPSCTTEVQAPAYLPHQAQRVFARGPEVLSLPGITHKLIPSRRGFPSPLGCGRTQDRQSGSGHQDTETKAKAGKERRRRINDHVKGKALHATRFKKMHLNVHFRLQFSRKALGLIFC